MSKFKNLIRYIYDVDYRFISMANRGKLNKMSDKDYLERMFRIKMHRKLNLDNPQTFNEKLQWLKINDRRPDYTKMVDKYEVKRYVSERIGEEYIIPNLGIWESYREIDFNQLPSRFVLKCTHDSGGLVIVRDKKHFDVDAAKTKIERSLKNNYFYWGREWPYKGVKPRIIAEEYLEDSSGNGLRDYKFYCFDGEPQFLYISEGLENHSTAKISFVNLDWTFADFSRSDYEQFSQLPSKPECFEEMIKIARALSSGYAFLRVDLYEIKKHIYFSELTFSPCSGFMPFSSELDDYKMGELLKIE